MNHRLASALATAAIGAGVVTVAMLEWWSIVVVGPALGLASVFARKAGR